MRNTYKVEDNIQKRGFNMPSPSTELKMVVTIPAKNEEFTIGKTLQALKNQIKPDGSLLSITNFEVLVLCNNCSDQTLKVCQNFKSKYPNFPIHIFSITFVANDNMGSIRKFIMDIAAERLPKNGFIITTDADTICSEDWLYQISTYLDTNIDLVCGKILVDDYYLVETAKNYLRAKNKYLYLLSQLESTIFTNPSDPWPRHANNSGPNLAITKRAYQKIGGMPQLKTLEDIGLYEQVLYHGMHVRHCLDTVVTTSARLDSRVIDGFGYELNAWAKSETYQRETKVEGLDKLVKKFEAYEWVKQCFLRQDTYLLRRIARRLCMDIQEVKQLFNSCMHYQQMVLELEKKLPLNEKWNMMYPDQHVFEALKAMEDFLELKQKEYA